MQDIGKNLWQELAYGVNKSKNFHCVENFKNLSMIKRGGIPDTNILKVNLNSKFFSDYGEKATQIKEKISFKIIF